MTFAEDWLRRARARQRARMVRFIETTMAERLGSMEKLTPEELSRHRVVVEPYIAITFDVGSE